MKPVQRLELLKDFVQEAVDKGATSVQQIHQYIADLPFEALEKSGLLDDERLQLRDRQRRTIGMVYDAIRSINQQIGDLISDQFENIEDAQKAARNLSMPPAPAAASTPAPKKTHRPRARRKIDKDSAS